MLLFTSMQCSMLCVLRLFLLVIQFGYCWYFWFFLLFSSFLFTSILFLLFHVYHFASSFSCSVVEYVDLCCAEFHLALKPKMNASCNICCGVMKRTIPNTHVLPASVGLFTRHSIFGISSQIFGYLIGCIFDPIQTHAQRPVHLIIQNLYSIQSKTEKLENNRKSKRKRKKSESSQ